MGGRGVVFDLLTHGGIFDGLVIVLPLTEWFLTRGKGWFVLVGCFFCSMFGWLRGVGRSGKGRVCYISYMLR